MAKEKISMKAAKAAKKNIEKKKVEKKVDKNAKTYIILEMVEQGRNRKQIIDKLVNLNNDISRKSNAGLVSHTFKKHNLFGIVESGVDRTQKKKIKAAKAS